MRTVTLLTVVGLALGMAPALCAGDLKIGEPAPEFSLNDTQGTSHTLADYKGKLVVLEWTSYDCPFVKKHYSGGNMQKLQKAYTEKGVVWLAINSSAPGKQGNYAPEVWNEMIKAKGAASTAVLLDPDGKVGRQYGAKTTPHMFIIDAQGALIYQGAIDSKRSWNAADIEGAKNYVSEALDAALAGKPVPTASTQPYGCSVKY